ncbi:MAG: DivIVA domain-containing protein [Acutalibacteraceae bacterium]|jgi:cell division initiation protein|nr:DivIVA domain-containing protein [Acutalibacteraceae bacterium]
MISIEDAKNVQFKNSVKGYKKEEVDQFIDEVVATLEQNKKEKIELVKKLDILAKRIEQYRKDEEDVRGALINAEKVKGSAVKQAEEKVAALLEEAKAEAKRIIYDANASVVAQKNNYLKLQADAVVLREQLLATYNNHIRMLEDLPTSADIGQAKIELDNQYPTDPVQPVTLMKSTEEVEETSEESEEEMTDISNN